MMEFFLGGGLAMVFVLAFGATTFVVAVRFWRSLDERHVGTVRALGTATTFSVLAGVCANIAAVCKHVPANPEWSQSDEMPLIVMMGIGESMAPAILGFSLLSLSWLFLAAGVRRLGASADV